MRSQPGLHREIRNRQKTLELSSPWSPLSWEGGDPAGRRHGMLLAALKQGNSLLFILKNVNTPLLYLTGAMERVCLILKNISHEHDVF